MQEFGASHSNSSHAPLLSPVSKSSDDGSDSDARASSYGSTSGKKRAVPSISNHSDNDGDDNYDDDDEEYHRDEELGDAVHGGVQKADAINQVWSKAALVTAYLLYADDSHTNTSLWLTFDAVSFCAPLPTLCSGRSLSILCPLLLASFLLIH